MDDREQEDECLDLVPPMASDQLELMEEIMLQKKAAPAQFASHWEQDEEDVDEATDEEIQASPVLRVLWAAETGREEVVMEMLDTDKSLVSCVDRDGYSPLHRAAYNGHCKVAELLLSRGAAVDARTHDLWTPLHSASTWGQHQSAATLLRHGADVNALTRGRQSPLHLAAANSQSQETVTLLLMHPGVRYDLLNTQEETALVVARRCFKHHHLFDLADPSINQLS